MSSKINQRRTLLALNAGLLLSSLAAGNAMAAECGQAKLIEAGSASVNVSKNKCQEQSRLSLGAVLELPSGSRMWVKFDPRSGESFQLICQNKSSASVSVNVASATAPGIKPQGLKNCEQWVGNKLSCESSDGEKNSFFCALAGVKQKLSSAAPGVRTSVKMRALLGKVTMPPAEEVIERIKPDVELCKNLYNISGKLDTSWSVSLGAVKDLAVHSENNDLVSCVEGVVKQAGSKQDLTVKYSF